MMPTASRRPRRRLTVLLTLLGLLVLQSGALAQGLPTARPEEVGLSSERLARVSEALRGEIKAGRMPGAVALVARRGRVVYFESFGVRDVATGEAMPRDAIFRLYSMTKPLTSAGALILIEQGRLLLGDPVETHLPEFAARQVAAPQFDPVSGRVTSVDVRAERAMTVYDLLRHTSGLASGRTQNAAVRARYEAEKIEETWVGVTPAQQLERLAKTPLAHQPGTTWEYGVSTDVLGRVIERVSGMRLGEFLGQALFAPLRLTDAGFTVPRPSAARLAQPPPMDARGRPIQLIDVAAVPPIDSGGAGAVATAADYARFAQMLLNGGRLDGAQVLSPTTVAFMTADHVGALKVVPLDVVGRGFGFGLGFAVRRDAAGIVPGSVGDYYWAGAAGTAFWVDPKEQMLSVLMTQGALFGGAHTNALFRQVVRQAIVD